MSQEPTILIVDDDDELRELYRLFLKDSYQVLSTGSGEEALELLDESVDILVLDRSLPDIDGNVILDRQSELQATSVIVVSGFDSDFQSDELEFGEYLTKPVSREDVLKAVERAHTDLTSSEDGLDSTSVA